MGLKNFLKQRGFIEEEPGDKIKGPVEHSIASEQPVADVTPTFFPFHPTENAMPVPASAEETPSDPSFVAPLQQNTTPQDTNAREQLDPTFVRFFEDELVKANLPGLDYFEFRQQLIKTQQKMTAKGMAAPEVVLQAVLMNFESQDIPPTKLIDAARQYKVIIKQKNDDFLKGASAEKNKQLQKRQSVLQSHNDNIKKIQEQLRQLELQKQQLDQSMNTEKTQLEINKTLGKEAIEKIEKAERLITLAHNYIQSTIDTDIKRLQSV